MGTTTFAIVMALVGFVVVLALNLIYKIYKTGWNWRLMLSQSGQVWKGAIGPAAIVTVVLWALLFGIFVLRTDYDDHKSLVSAATKASATERCWFQNYSGVSHGGNAPTGAKSVSETIVVCNKNYAPPIALEVRYDQNLAGANQIAFPIGGMSSLTETVKGNEIGAVVEAPSIRAYEPFRVVAFGQSENLPIAKKLVIKTASTREDFAPEVNFDAP